VTFSGAALVAALDDATSELDQALALLERAGEADPAAITLGAGDRLLVALVEQVTGRPIELTARCPACGETNEIVLSSDQLPEYCPRTRWLGVGLGVREPTYHDLFGLPRDERAAVLQLGGRCAVGVVPPAVAADELDEVDGSLVGPIDIRCVECGAAIDVEADAQQLALRCLRRRAEQIDREVHLLASHYGWDLATIEALPDARRERLTRMVEGG
jgi:hypothetical protein